MGLGPVDERDGVPVVAVVVVVLVTDLDPEIVMIAAQEEEQEVLPEVKPYIIPPHAAPTWIGLWPPASATRPATMSPPKSA
jgi:hypothetical protein